MQNQQKPQNSYMAMAVNFLTNPYVLAGLGGAAGYYFFGREDGKTMEGKRPYVAAGIGAVSGLAAGKVIQHMRMNQARELQQQQQAQINAQQQAQAQAQAQAQGMADYYDMETVEGEPNVDEVFGQQAPAQYQEQGVPIQTDLEASVDTMGLGSLDGTNLGSNGLGSLGRDDGFDAYDEGVDEAISDVQDKLRQN